MNKYGNDDSMKKADGSKMNPGSLSNAVFVEAAIHL
jgi:hypothetical protein